MVIQVRAITWIGFCKRVEHKKMGDTETKVLEIPFKIEGNRTKFLLRVSKTKVNKAEHYVYELYQVTQEYMGVIETFKQEAHVNETTVLIDLVMQHKKAKREVRWLRGWF